jgi:hypothetical protein
VLLDSPLGNVRLDSIDEDSIEAYKNARARVISRRKTRLSPASINRELATLTRLLRMAHEFKLIGWVPGYGSFKVRSTANTFCPTSWKLSIWQLAHHPWMISPCCCSTAASGTLKRGYSIGRRLDSRQRTVLATATRRSVVPTARTPSPLAPTHLRDSAGRGGSRRFHYNEAHGPLHGRCLSALCTSLARGNGKSVRAHAGTQCSGCQEDRCPHREFFRRKCQ